MNLIFFGERSWCLPRRTDLFTYVQAEVSHQIFSTKIFTRLLGSQEPRSTGESEFFIPKQESPHPGSESLLISGDGAVPPCFPQTFLRSSAPFFSTLISSSPANVSNASPPVLHQGLIVQRLMLFSGTSSLLIPVCRCQVTGGTLMVIGH